MASVPQGSVCSTVHHPHQDGTDVVQCYSRHQERSHDRVRSRERCGPQEGAGKVAASVVIYKTPKDVPVPSKQYVLLGVTKLKLVGNKWEEVPDVYTFHKTCRQYYYSIMSAGAINYVLPGETTGPCGESVVGQHEWYLEYVGGFEDWNSVVRFLENMRVTNISMLEDN